MRHETPPLHPPGFTLIEALVGLAILAMAAGALTQTLGTASLRRRTIEAEAAAVPRAEAVLARVGTELPLSPGDLTGPGWSLHIARHGDPAAPPTPLVTAWDVEVRVPTLGPHELRLSTIRLGPATPP